MQIALVDPSRTVLKAVGSMLQSHGHQVVTFPDAPAAIEHLRRNREVNAMITSVELPSASGLELCWEARLLASAERPLYVIVMSSNHRASKLGEALDSGADDFIGKPPVEAELCARLRAAERLVTLQSDLIKLATTDALTGLLNRRSFFGRASAACEHAEGGAALSAIMLDIDLFKRINDTYGHDAGDAAIQAVALALHEDGRLVGRLGGEEFAIVLEDCSMAAAADHAEQLRTRIADLPLEIEGDMLTITCSFGVSEYRKGDSIDTLLKRADRALYAAKSAGRNRVIVDGPDIAPPPPGCWDSLIRGSERSPPR
jgi:diguanylate cyclase (GGDEF)-like protein